MKSIILNVTGMSCNHCKSSVEEALGQLEGVSNVNVNLETGRVEVTYDESAVSLEAMREAVEDQGYEVA